MFSYLCFDTMHLQASDDVLWDAFWSACKCPKMCQACLSQAEPAQADTLLPSDAETFCSTKRSYLRMRHLTLNSMTPGVGLATLVTTALIILLVMNPLGAR